MSYAIPSELIKLSEQIATEVVLARPGQDDGLLPVNHLLGRIEEVIAQSPPPEVLARAVELAREWVDGVLDSTGLFTPVALQRLMEWCDWVQHALRAWEGKRLIPDLPADWETVEFASTNPAPQAEPKRTEVDEPEPAVTLNLEQDGEVLREFANESLEHLQRIEQGVLILEANPKDAETLHSIFRAFHTFKGGAGFLNLTAIQTLAHELESLLDLARQHKLAMTSPVINLILEGRDTLKQFVLEIEAQLAGTKPCAPIVVPTLAVLGRVRAILRERKQGGEPLVAEGFGSDRPIPADLNSPGPVGAADSGPSISGSSPPQAAPKIGASGSSVKVDTQKLDGLVDLIGELMIAQSLVVQNPALNALESEQLNRDLAQLARVTKDLQRNAMSLRMVPVRSTFHKMHRLVRDISAKVGKPVQLITEGEETELDRTIVEAMGDPLVHLIRNALDHGIEESELRVERGKPVQGTIRLRAFYQGGCFVLQIEDDGNGLNRKRILAKAIERGLVRPGEDLTDEQVFSLILAAGFSTAEKVTDLSGRGVGLDVVRRNVEKLHGKIDIRSTPGGGSCFSISLPLTLAIIDGLIVVVGGDRYILPTLSVCESFRPSPEMISTVYGRGEMLSVRGRLYPLLRLSELLGIEPASRDPAQGIAIVVQAGAHARCVLVDQLLGKQEVVIKSLGETFRGNRCHSGAAILGDGRVALILNPEALVRG